MTQTMTSGESLLHSIDNYRVQPWNVDKGHPDALLGKRFNAVQARRARWISVEVVELYNGYDAALNAILKLERAQKRELQSYNKSQRKKGIKIRVASAKRASIAHDTRFDAPVMTAKQKQVWVDKLHAGEIDLSRDTLKFQPWQLVEIDKYRAAQTAKRDMQTDYQLSQSQQIED